MHHHPPLEADRLAAVDHARRLNDARRPAAASRRPSEPRSAGPSMRSTASGSTLRRLLVAGVALLCLGAVGALAADASTSDGSERPGGVVIGTPPMYQ